MTRRCSDYVGTAGLFCLWVVSAGYPLLYAWPGQDVSDRVAVTLCQVLFGLLTWRFGMRAHLG